MPLACPRPASALPDTIQQESPSSSAIYQTTLVIGNLQCLVLGCQASNQVNYPNNCSSRKLYKTSRAPSPASELQALTPPGIMTEPVQGATMDRILQEISAVGRRLEGMDNAMASVTAKTKSMSLDLAGFQPRVLGLEQRVSTVETHINSFMDRDQELLYLQSKLIELEDRSHRDNVCFLGFPETIEGAGIHSYLRETLPKLTSLTFDPSLEFHRVHRLGPKRREDANRPCPIIACLLRHVQTRQLLQAARSHGAFRMDGLEIRLTADFSRDQRTAESVSGPSTSFASNGSEIWSVRTGKNVDHQKWDVQGLLRP
ncbi:hypothetical protein NDU88_007497 [Pleurodeles waltl]|uniref:Uncharacterized protein n=1 Tax=Pleurodeles waltl TaxID=8319 RepID=A0AAV7VT24_PLEWA|nr:hypothetical protein NDU88_007497 [Pleurodeles waltl]